MVYHFVDSDLRVEIFFNKEVTAEKEASILKYRIETPLHTSIGVEENSMQNLSTFIYLFFLVTEKE